MLTIIDVMRRMEQAIGESAIDSTEAIKREFTVAQTQFGADIAMHALITLYVIAEKQRRYLQERPQPIALDSSVG